MTIHIEGFFFALGAGSEKVRGMILSFAAFDQKEKRMDVERWRDELVCSH
ncbi:hypothetical protein [Polystyrenella longa]|nr:hypothetical protein [Polystyrenella longa]